MILCTSTAVAGEVVVLLLECTLFPRTHYRIDQMDRDGVIITVMNPLSRAQDAQIRTDVAEIEGASIQ